MDLVAEATEQYMRAKRKYAEKQHDLDEYEEVAVPLLFALAGAMIADVQLRLLERGDKKSGPTE